MAHTVADETQRQKVAGRPWDVALSHWAARHGELEFLQWARRCTPPLPWDETTCVEAIDGNHRHVLQWLRENGCPWSKYSGDGVVKKGDLEWLQWLRKNHYPLHDDFSIATAAQQGHLHILQWWNTVGLTEQLWNLIFDLAAHARHVHILQWVHSLGCPVRVEQGTVTVLAYFEHLVVLQWLQGNGYAPKCTVWQNAIQTGNLVLLHWLGHQSKPFDTATFCMAAARQGCLEVLQWLRTQHPPCPWDEKVCMEAARQGHLEVLQWLRAQHPPCPWNKTICTAAVHQGHLDVLQWLRAQHPPCPWDVQDIVRTAVDRHRWDILVWMQRFTAPQELLCSSTPSTQDQYHYTQRHFLLHHSSLAIAWPNTIHRWMKAVESTSRDLFLVLLCSDLVSLIQQYC